MKREIFLILALFPLILSAQQSEINNGFDRVSQLYSNGNYPGAKSEMDRVRMEITRANVEQRYGEQVDYWSTVISATMNPDEAKGVVEQFFKKYPYSRYREGLNIVYANALYAAKDYKAAAEQYAKIDKRDLSTKERDEFTFRYGHSLFILDDYNGAERVLKLIPKISPRWASATYYLSYIYYVDGDYPRARDGFESIALSAQYSKIVPFYILHIEYLEGNYKYVVENGDALMNSAAKTRAIELARILSQSWFALEDYAKALDYMNAYRSLGGEMERMENYIEGVSRYRVNDYKVAAEHLVKVCVGNDDITQNAAYHLGDCYLQLGDKRQAANSFLIASSIESSKETAEDALFNYCKLQYELEGGIFNEAINSMRRYMESYPNSVHIDQVQEFLVSALYNSKNYQEAYEIITKLKNPDNNIKSAMQKIIYFRALELFGQGDLKEAGKLLNQTLNYNYDAKYSALARYWLAEISLAEGENEKAIKYYKDYYRLSPKNEREHIFTSYGLGYCYFNLKSWAESESWFKNFLNQYQTADTYTADTYNRLGDCYYAQRSFWKAADSYDMAAKSTTNEKYYGAYNRALMLGFVDRVPRKIDELKAIIAANQGGYVDAAMYELGRTYVGEERYADAATTLQEYVAKYPSSPNHINALSDLGLVYQNLNNSQEALKYYKQVVNLAPNSQASKDAMGGIKALYVDMNQVQEYFDYAKSAGIEISATVIEKDSLSFVAAQKTYLAGSQTAGVKAMAGYLGNFPKGAFRADALYLMAQHQIKMGDMALAKSSLEDLSTLPFNQYSVEGLRQIAQLCADDKQWSEATEYYRRLAELSQDDKQITMALNGYLSSVIAMGDKSQILSVSNNIIDNFALYPEPVRRAAFEKAQIVGGAEGREIYRSLAKDATNAQGAESAYILIEESFKNGDLDGAESSIMDFAKQNTTQSYFLAKAFITLGDIYIKRGDSFQARATFQSIIDGYSIADDGIIALTKQKIEELK